MAVHNQSKGLIILLHEIYGVNDHIIFLKSLFEKEGFDVICPNMFKEGPFSYSDEIKAYNYFVNEVGFEFCYNEVKKLVEFYQEQYKTIFIVGFSIGATTAWLSSELAVQGVVSFYGSRIRDFLHISPVCPVLLIFANQEKSFNVKELVEKLSRKRRVKTIIVDSDHGFANPFSDKYDEISFQIAKETMLAFINTQISTTKIVN